MNTYTVRLRSDGMMTEEREIDVLADIASDLRRIAVALESLMSDAARCAHGVTGRDPERSVTAPGAEAMTTSDQHAAREIIGPCEPPRHEEPVEWCTACRCYAEGLHDRIAQALTAVRAEARREERERAERLVLSVEFPEECKVEACDHTGPNECLAAAIRGQEGEGWCTA